MADAIIVEKWVIIIMNAFLEIVITIINIKYKYNNKFKYTNKRK